jgi:hypothetical protein
MKCHNAPSENTNAAPTPTMPYTDPLPGVREPRNRIKAAEISGSSTTSQACSTNQVPFVEASKVTSPAANRFTT